MGATAKLEVSPAQLREFAAIHGTTAERIATWATENENFPAVYLRTHGAANYKTYVQLLAYYLAKRAAGGSLAEANRTASNALTISARLFEVNDRAAGDLVRGVGVPRR